MLTKFLYIPLQILTRDARRSQARRRRTRTRAPARQLTSVPLWRRDPAKNTRTGGRTQASKTVANPTTTREIPAAGGAPSRRLPLAKEEKKSAQEDARTSNNTDTSRITRTSSGIRAETRITTKAVLRREGTKIDGEAGRRSLCGEAGKGQSRRRGAARRPTPGTPTGTAWRGRTKRTGVLTDTAKTGGKRRKAEMDHLGGTDSRFKEDQMKTAIVVLLYQH